MEFIEVASAPAARLCAPVWEFAHDSSCRKLPETNGEPLVASGGMPFASLLSEPSKMRTNFFDRFLGVDFSVDFSVGLDD
jgi:hypothetical protein